MDRYKHRVHKVDGSSKWVKITCPKWTDHPSGWKLHVQNGRIQTKVHKVDGSSKWVKITCPKWTDTNRSPQTGRIIQVGENYMSKIDEYKQKSTKWTDHPSGWKFQNGRIQTKVHKVDGLSKWVKITCPKWTNTNKNPQSGRIIQVGENYMSKMDGYKQKSTKWTDHPKRTKIWSPKWTDINQSPQSGRIIQGGWKFEVRNGWI